LEHEFGLRFEDGNIGPSADLPAFVTLLQTKKRVPLWVLLSALFFLGKPLEENFEAWGDMAKELRPFLKHSVYFNRQGAAALAVQAVTVELGHDPQRIQLLSYRVLHISEAEDPADLECEIQIVEAPSTLHLGFIKHVFLIEADGVAFRVIVEGKNTKTVRLS
jgi:hypothetical protein